MAGTVDIEKKINDWLLEEQQTITKLQQDKADFLFRIDRVLGTAYTVNVAKIKKRDLIQAVFGINIQPKVKKELLKKEKKKISPLLNEIQINLSLKGVIFAWMPNFDEMTQIQIIDNLFTSELTKTQLFDSIRMVKDAGVLTLLIINKYVNIEPGGEGKSGSMPGVS